MNLSGAQREQMGVGSCKERDYRRYLENVLSIKYTPCKILNKKVRNRISV